MCDKKQYRNAGYSGNNHEKPIDEQKPAIEKTSKGKPERRTKEMEFIKDTIR